MRSACGARDAQSVEQAGREDSAGRLRPTAAARMNGNSLLSKLDKRCGQEAGCSGAPARRRPGGRHGSRSTALTHEALACAGRAATPPPVKNACKSGKFRYFPQGAPPPGPPGQAPFMDVPPRRGRRGCRPPVSEAYSLGAAALRKQGSTGRSTFLAPIRPLGVFLSRARARSKRHTMRT